MTAISLSDSYDILPYGNYAHANTQPERLALLPYLFGLDPAPGENCRYLELGCALGGNIIPLAAAYPNSEFVGIDISQAQISFGQKVITDAGLGNIQLINGDFAKLAQELGKFDFIVAHGIFSWVAPEVQDSIIQIMASNLSDRGIGYVSYNVLPGWYVRQPVREIINFHSRKESDPLKRIAAGRQALRFIASCLRHRPTPDKTAVAVELETALSMPDWSIQHDYLSIDNEAIYVSDFISRAEKHHLHYVGDTEMVMNWPQEFPTQVQQMIRAQPVIEAEQYMDFARNRMFRRTLLSRQAVMRTIPAERVEKLYFRSLLKEQNDGSFIHPNGGGLPSPSPAAAQALRALQMTFPGEISFNQLVETVGAVKSDLLAPLSSLLLAGLVEAVRTPFPCKYSVTGTPASTSLARFQLAHGNNVINLRHEEVVLTPDEAKLLLQLDGRTALPALQQTFVGDLSQTLTALMNKGLIAS